MQGFVVSAGVTGLGLYMVVPTLMPRCHKCISAAAPPFCVNIVYRCLGSLERS